MKRSTGATVLLAAVSGCMAPDTDNTSGQYMAHAWNRSAPDGVHWGVQSGPPTVASVMGPDGRPVPMAAPYTYSPPTGEAAARAMLAKSVPLDLIQQAGFTKNGAAGPEVLQAQGMCPPGGCPPGMPPGGGLAPPGVPPLPAPSPFTTNLVENVERLKLDVQRVAHIHGGVNSWDEILKAAGR